MPRPRLSILNMLLLVTIVAMAIVIAQFWREIGPLRAEVRQQRVETGRISVDDPGKIYAVPIPETLQGENAWKWRVYLPTDRKYSVHVVSGEFDDKMRPKDVRGFQASTTIDSGELLVQVKPQKDTDGRWIARYSTEPPITSKNRLRVNKGGVTSITHSDWLDQPGATQNSGVASVQHEYPPNQPVELLRIRAGKLVPQFPNSKDPLLTNAGTTTFPATPTTGVVVWIDKEKP